MPHSAAKPLPGQLLLCLFRFKFPVEFVCTIEVKGRTAWRFVSILISSALAGTDSEMKLNRILFSCLEQKCGQCELRRVSDHYFNVCLGISGRKMELTRTCCFEFARKRGADSKRLFLPAFCFYFMLARFTHLSPLPEVDKGTYVKSKEVQREGVYICR